MKLDFQYYKQTDHELWINKQYQQHGIQYPADMDIDFIANIFNVDVFTYKGKCTVEWDDLPGGLYENAFIILDAFLPEDEKREIFFHELPHPLLHVGNQNKMPELFVHLQEVQAAQFQLYAAMPIYMLTEYQDISSRETYLNVLATDFKLPFDFVEKRIDQIERRINQELSHQNFIAEITDVHFKYDYMPETLQMLDKLNNLLRIKGRLV